MWCYGADIVHFPIYYSLGESKSTTSVVCYAGPQTSGPEMTKPFTDHPILVFTPPLSCYVNVSCSSRCFSAFFYLAWKKKKSKTLTGIIWGILIPCLLWVSIIDRILLFVRRVSRFWLICWGVSPPCCNSKLETITRPRRSHSKVHVGFCGNPWYKQKTGTEGK